MTESEKQPRGQISSDVRDASSLKLDLGGDGIEIFVGELGAKIIEAVQDKYEEKNYFVDMKELMEELELSMGEDIPSRTAVLNKVIELGGLDVIFVQEVTGHGGKKIQVGPISNPKELFEEMAKETVGRLNEELQTLDSEFTFSLPEVDIDLEEE